MTVAYYFCGEPIPYRTTVRGGAITLGHFRELLTRRGASSTALLLAQDVFQLGVSSDVWVGHLCNWTGVQ
ncbi:axin-1-like isoform X1 [Clarias magur]|uniref:Axin-1-like isoform X1 n=1 Tax=Clarias magur TaxID=1594786 RepID=A0A8J4T436_CLAMG|nr:axin-1-like isoform X1 [Clarias magur]